MTNSVDTCKVVRTYVQLSAYFVENVHISFSSSLSIFCRKCLHQLCRYFWLHWRSMATSMLVWCLLNYRFFFVVACMSSSFYFCNYSCFSIKLCFHCVSWCTPFSILLFISFSLILHHNCFNWNTELTYLMFQSLHETNFCSRLWRGLFLSTEATHFNTDTETPMPTTFCVIFRQEFSCRRCRPADFFKFQWSNEKNINNNQQILFLCSFIIYLP